MRVFDDGAEGILEVQDQGPGIAAEHLPHLGERFYRVDAARSRQDGGSGLGLAITKAILERYRGRLEVASEASNGVVARMILPLAND